MYQGNAAHYVADWALAETFIPSAATDAGLRLFRDLALQVRSTDRHPSPSQPPDSAFANFCKRDRSGMAHLHLMLKSCGRHLESTTHARLEAAPDLVAVLAGAKAFAEIPLREGEDPNCKEILKFKIDLHLLGDLISFSTRQRLTTTFIGDPPGTLALVNLDMVDACFEPATAVVSGCLKIAQRGSPDQIVGEELLQKLRENDFKGLSKESFSLEKQNAQIKRGEIVHTPCSTKAIGMICYCANTSDLADLKTTLVAWAENFQVFGHTSVPIVLSDDSAPVMHACILELAHQITKEFGIRIICIGQEQRRMILESLSKKVVERPKVRQIAAAHGQSPSQLQEALVEVLGERGPAENRNFLNLLLPTPYFQCDHDMHPAVYTDSVPCRKSKHAGYENISATDLRTKPFSELTEDEMHAVVPYDLLRQFDDLSPGQITSPEFSGAHDRAIALIYAEKRHLKFWEFDRHSGICHDYGKATYKNVSALGTSSWTSSSPGERSQVRAPLFVTNSPSVSNVILQPPLRDGDVLVTPCLQALGFQNKFIPAAIYHARLAGSAWGGKVNLLLDATLSEAASYLCMSAQAGSKSLDEYALQLMEKSGMAEPEIRASNQVRKASYVILTDLISREKQINSLETWMSDLQNPDRYLEKCQRIFDWTFDHRRHSKELHMSECMRLAKDVNFCDMTRKQMLAAKQILLGEFNDLTRAYHLDAERMMLVGKIWRDLNELIVIDRAMRFPQVRFDQRAAGNFHRQISDLLLDMTGLPRGTLMKELLWSEREALRLKIDRNLTFAQLPCVQWRMQDYQEIYKVFPTLLNEIDDAIRERCETNLRRKLKNYGLALLMGEELRLAATALGA